MTSCSSSPVLHVTSVDQPWSDRDCVGSTDPVTSQPTLHILARSGRGYRCLQCFVRDLNIHPERFHDRRIDVTANGLPFLPAQQL